MHGDFSRWTDDAQKHYTGVLEQQGRVRVDADFNEYVAIQQRLRQITTRDVLGLTGAPLEGGGFEISASVDQEGATPRPRLRISKGRIYVDGILCHLALDTDYDDQDDYPLPDENEVKLEFPEETSVFTALVYLDVWQRHVTANEDPNLRDVALGGPDTTTRLQTVCQVKIKKNVTGEAALCEDPLPVDKPNGGLSTHDVEEPSTAENPCIVAPGGGYRGLENRLYRVEIHKGGDLSGEDKVTFKWSRDNGSVVYRITAFKEAKNRVEISELGRDRLLALRSDDWVEVLGEETELRGQSGTLAQIKEIDEARRLITFKEGTDVSAHKDERNPRLRRWDGVGKNGQGIDVSEDKIELEDGIRVSFSGETFRTGDYWFFAARTATREVELLEERPPQGISHHYAKLALVTWRQADQDWHEEVRDCRPLFPPLTALTQLLYVGGDGQEALPGERLCQPLQVRVVNGNRPIEGERVRFNLVTPGEGQLRTPDEAGSTVTAITDDQGLARCEWTLGSNPENRCRQVEAVLLNHDGNPASSSIRFNASLSTAAQVYYDTSRCERLREVEANTVQQAIDQICKELTEPGIKVREITFGNGDELRNDTGINMEAFRSGIILTCDRPIDPRSVKRPTCFVTLEVPYRDSNDRLTSAAFTAITLAGVQKADGPRIIWALTERTDAWLTKEISAYRERLQTEGLLVRLTVKGNFVWAQDKPGLYLDGETYGIPAGDGSIGLDMKQGSGNGRRGGDFEMWFWLGGRAGEPIEPRPIEPIEPGPVAPR